MNLSKLLRAANAPVIRIPVCDCQCGGKNHGRRHAA